MLARGSQTSVMEVKGKKTASPGKTRSIPDSKTACHVEITQATQTMSKANTTKALSRGKKRKIFHNKKTLFAILCLDSVD